MQFPLVLPVRGQKNDDVFPKIKAKTKFPSLPQLQFVRFYWNKQQKKNRTTNVIVIMVTLNSPTLVVAGQNPAEGFSNKHNKWQQQLQNNNKTHRKEIVL